MEEIRSGRGRVRGVETTRLPSLLSPCLPETDGGDVGSRAADREGHDGPVAAPCRAGPGAQWFKGRRLVGGQGGRRVGGDDRPTGAVRSRPEGRRAERRPTVARPRLFAPLGGFGRARGRSQ